MWLENIFCQTVAWFFICITLLLKDQKFLILIKSNLSIFIFWIMFLVSNMRNLCVIQSHKYFVFFSFTFGTMPSSRSTLWKVQTSCTGLSRTLRFHGFSTICCPNSASSVELLLLTFCSWVARWCQSADGWVDWVYFWVLSYPTDIRSILSQVSHCISHYVFTTFEIR